MDTTPTVTEGTSSHTRHALVALAFVALAAEIGYSIVNISALAPFVRYLHLEALIGVFLAAFLLSEAILKTPMGAWGDRVGRRRLVVVGLLISATCQILIAGTRNSLGIIGVRILDGVGAAMVWPAVFALASDHSHEDHRTGAMGLINTMYVAALAVGPMLGGALNDLTHSVKASFYLAAGVMVIAALVSGLVLPSSRAHRARAAAAGEQAHAGLLRELVVGLKLVPDLVPMALITFAGVGTLAPIVKLFSMDVLGLTESKFGIIMAVAAVCVAVASMRLGRLADRIGRVRTVRIGVATIAVCLWVLTWVAAGRAPHGLASLLMTLLAAVLGLGFVITVPAWLAIVVSRGKEKRRGAVVGVVGTAQGVGMVFGAAAGGWLYKTHGHYTPFLVSAVLLSLAFLGVLLIKEHR